MKTIDLKDIAKSSLIKEGERIDDLQINDLMLLQKKDGYCFNSDSVLLANIVRVLPSEKVVDLGTGSGVIAILLAAKTRSKQIFGVEIQKGLYERACRSVQLNNLADRVTIICEDMQNAHKKLGCDFDVVVCNPPYQPLSNAEKRELFSTDLNNTEDTAMNHNLKEADICRKEYCITLDGVALSAAKLLKHGGLFYVIIKASRLAEMIYSLKTVFLEPKKLWMVQPKADRDVDTVIIKAKKGAKPSMTAAKPIVVFNPDDSYTEEAKELYGKGDSCTAKERK